MNNYVFGSFTIVTPDLWKDITESLNDDDVPFTLARDDGKGALQISEAKYYMGKNPNITLSELDSLRESFAKAKGFSGPFNESRLTGTAMISAASYHRTDDYLRVWYCSNGQDIAMCTYLSDWGSEGTEPDDCDQIIKRMQFHRRK